MPLIHLLFFLTAKGNSPVEDFISALPETDQRAIYAAIRDVMIEFPDMVLTSIKKLQNKIWEIRLSLSVGEVRILFSPAKGNTLKILSAFVKKTQKTPLEELRLAEERLKTL
jgi:phage-related protein